MSYKWYRDAQRMLAFNMHKNLQKQHELEAERRQVRGIKRKIKREERRERARLRRQGLLPPLPENPPRQINPPKCHAHVYVPPPSLEDEQSWFEKEPEVPDEVDYEVTLHSATVEGMMEVVDLDEGSLARFDKLYEQLSLGPPPAPPPSPTSDSNSWTPWVRRPTRPIRPTARRSATPSSTLIIHVESDEDEQISRYI